MASIEHQPAASKRKRTWLNLGLEIGVVVVVSAALYLLITAESGEVFDGEFQLTITAVPKSGRHVRSLSYATESKRESAEAIARDSNAAREVVFRGAERQGDQFVAEIGFSGHSANGVVKSYHEPRFVVVAITYDEGDAVRQVVEIPAGRGKRSVSVALP